MNEKTKLRLKKKMNKTNSTLLYFFIAFLFTTQNTDAQPVYLPLSNTVNYRFEKKTAFSSANFHSSIKPFLISEIPEYDSIMYKLRIPVYSYNYPIYNTHLIQFKSYKYKTNIYLNPVIDAFAGKDVPGNKGVNRIRAGINIKGTVGEKFGFHTSLAWSNDKFPVFLQSTIDSTNVLPQYSKYLSKNGSRYVYYPIKGYLSYSPSKLINLQLGYDRNFLGHGYRSLLLSDFTASYPFFKLSVKVWNLKYISLHTWLKDINVQKDHCELYEKFTTIHYLSWNVTPWLNINLFESVIWSAWDEYGYRGFEWQYFNPVIFYRPLEFTLGSPDNVLMGAGGSIQPIKNLSLYGQGILDEFDLKKVKDQSGYWGNKFGVQIGAKWFEAFAIPDLYLQLEYNTVRPYTYSHGKALQNYGHMTLPLAHPLGANFKEFAGIIRYHLSKRLVVSSKNVFAITGTDPGEKSYGGDIYKPYGLRVSDYGNTITQGTEEKMLYNEIMLSYLINPESNLHIQGGVINRSITSEALYSDKDFFMVFIGFKTHLYNETGDFIPRR